jgi:hypothetical protein
MTTLPLATSSRVPAASLVPGDRVRESGIREGVVSAVFRDREYFPADRCLTVCFADGRRYLLHEARTVGVVGH